MIRKGKGKEKQTNKGVQRGRKGNWVQTKESILYSYIFISNLISIPTLLFYTFFCLFYYLFFFCFILLYSILFNFAEPKKIKKIKIKQKG